jgi:hypothetical protein
VINLFVKLTGLVDEAANYVFVQLTEQKPTMYNKLHVCFARRDKIGLAWERISHTMEESGTCVYVYIYYKQNV